MRRAWGTHPASLPGEKIPDERPGRKPVPARRVLYTVFWILTTGTQWRMLPQSYCGVKGVKMILPHRKNRLKPKTQDAGSYAATSAVGSWSGSLHGRSTNAGY